MNETAPLILSRKNDYKSLGSLQPSVLCIMQSLASEMKEERAVNQLRTSV